MTTAPTTPTEPTASRTTYPHSAGLSVLRHRRLSLLLHRRAAVVVTVLLLLLAGVMLLAACVGQTYVPPGEVWRVLRGHGGPYDLVVGELRVPRIVLGALVGAALGLQGARTDRDAQPLASPDVIGVGTGRRRDRTGAGHGTVASPARCRPSPSPADSPPPPWCTYWPGGTECSRAGSS
ncbi:iron chelate uptake ABC transporter family permease subunit [Streptomyces mirabilis]|nr:iron chelate uptake ABC transporter family permease subunit [Streptomyces mirabilis]